MNYYNLVYLKRFLKLEHIVVSDVSYVNLLNL